MIICAWKDVLRYAPALPGLEEAVEKINALNSLEPGVYPLENGNRFSVAAGTTIAPTVAEAHRKFVDVQYVVKGQEVMGYAPLERCAVAEPFSEEKDIGMYSGDFQYLTIGEGMCYIVFPEDAHMPSRHLETPSDFVKIVVKLKA